MWSKEDDCNTSFFHRMPNAHRRRNRLPKVKVNDSWHTEENEIKASVVRAFHNLFSEEGGWRPSIDGLTFEYLDSHKAKKLELPFRKKWCSLLSLIWARTKHQVQMGTPWHFWLFSWEFVKEEVLSFF